jgi:hypothetical protein
MASAASIAARAQIAREGIRAELEKLAAASGEQLTLEPVSEKDPALRAAKELEAIHSLVLALNVAFGVAVENAAGSGGLDPTALDGTVAEVAGYLDSISDPAALDMLEAAENGRGDSTRKGVLTAIEKRRAALEAEQAEGDNAEGAGEGGAVEFDLSPIAGNAAGAIAHVRTVTTAEELDALQAAETQAHPEEGRKGVMSAIEAQRAALAEAEG